MKLRTPCFAFVSMVGGLLSIPVATSEEPARLLSAMPLTVQCADRPPVELSAADWAKLPRKSVQAKSKSGTIETYEGVLLCDILKRAGATLGKQLRGPLLTSYVVFDAADGYQVVFSLAELDPDFTDNIVLLADRKDGAGLPPTHGPFQLIAPNEKRFSRWIRRVRRIEIRQPALQQKVAPAVPI